MACEYIVSYDIMNFFFVAKIRQRAEQIFDIEITFNNNLKDHENTLSYVDRNNLQIYIYIQQMRA